MILYFVRYRLAGEQEWHSWKFTHASGRLHAYLAVSASSAVLKQIAAALDYALTGAPSPLLHEVALQLGDHGGHTWLVQRRGNDSRIAKDTVPCSISSAEQELAEACLDNPIAAATWNAGSERLTVGHFEIGGHGTTCGDHDTPLSLTRLGAPVSPEVSLKAAAEAQIASIASNCAQRFARPQLAAGKTLAALGRKLDPMRLQYAELCRQYSELKNEAKDLLGKDLGQSSTLVQELELLDQLAAAAAPLLQPGASLKSLRDELAQLTAERAELRHRLGLGGDLPTKAIDFQAAIAGLSRLEAQARLIQAMGKARLQVAQHIEPLFQRYLQVAEGGLASDQQAHAELASCLASLGTRLTQKANLQQSEAMLQDKQKTWFDRFKNRSTQVDDQQVASPLEREVADLETAHLAITYTLGRLDELSDKLTQVGKKHDAALGAVDATYEELVRGFGALKQAWQEEARRTGLPETMELNSLLSFAADHGLLAQIEEKYRTCSERSRRFQTALQQVERLLLDWRKATGSQKTVDLSSHAILLSEASSLLRYRESKRLRLAQVKDQAVAAKAAATVLAQLKRRRQTLVADWSQAFTSAGLHAFEIHDDAVGELCRSAQLIDALAVVHTAAIQAKPATLFSRSEEPFALTLYHWDEEHANTKERLTFLTALEQAPEDRLHVLLLSDASFALALAQAGLGRAARVQSQVQQPVVEAPAPVIPGTPKRTPNVIKVPQQQRMTQTQPSAPSPLNDKARQALAMLTTRKL